MPWRAAKHIASSGTAASGVALSPAKLSPATNTSTACGEASLDSAAATSSTFDSLSPYRRLRVNDTPAQDFAGSVTASAGGADASAVSAVSAPASPTL